ncbi:vacuolar protein sorting-associated protein-like protein VPS4 [Xylogone sp. PMI_703]|nr:vacuolar protein sorting-associated protein-like protein VPS4 [Xylogone sp. PMI_703]
MTNPMRDKQDQVVTEEDAPKKERQHDVEDEVAQPIKEESEHKMNKEQETQNPPLDPNFLNMAIDIVKKAIEADTARRYSEALALYQRSLELFMLALKRESNLRSRELIRNKATEYMDRAEKLSNYLSGSSGKPGSSNNESKKQQEHGEFAGDVSLEVPEVKWEEVVGLDAAKQVLREEVVFPVKFSNMLKGKHLPWQGILLFGPPGCGKSHLLKAAAMEAHASIVNVRSSCLARERSPTDSQRLVEHIFAMAEENSPSIICVDYIETLCESQESESCRRLKAEMIARGKKPHGVDSRVFIIGITHSPWKINDELLKCFGKKVPISLPDLAARSKLFEAAIQSENSSSTEKSSTSNITVDEYKKLAERSEGYSPSDIHHIVDEGFAGPIREVQRATHFKKIMDTSLQSSTQERLIVCSPDDANALKMTWLEIDPPEKLYVPPPQFKHFYVALRASRPSVLSEEIKKYEDWADTVLADYVTVEYNSEEA